jgi:hypothetical protein
MCGVKFFLRYRLSVSGESFALNQATYDSYTRTPGKRRDARSAVMSVAQCRLDRFSRINPWSP